MALFSPNQQKRSLTRQWMGRTLLWLALIVAIGYTVGRSEFVFNTAPIAIEVETPRTVVIDPAAPVAYLPIVAKIKNNTDEPVGLEAPNPCEVFRWFVTTTDGEFVQSKEKEPCTQLIMNAYLNPGDIAKEQVDIALDARRFTPDSRYILIYRYWGYEDRVSFRTETK